MDSKGREIVIDLKNTINNKAKSGNEETQLPLLFAINITQLLPSSDEMAIISKK